MSNLEFICIDLHTSVNVSLTLPFCSGSRLSNVPKATVRCKTADTKSPKRRVPSFLMCRRTNADKTSLLTWKPTSKSESRKRSARKIPVFSLVWHLKAACHCFKLAMKSRKSESLRRPSPDTYFNQQPPPSIDIRCFLIRLVNKICIITSKTKMTCRHTSMLAQLLM